MSRRGRLRRLSRLVLWPSMLVAGCGGDKGPTGPGDEPAIEYDLAALGRIGLPADAQLEDCIETRFYGGQLEVTDDGSWRIQLQVHDLNSGDWPFLDEGEVDEDGADLWLHSAYSGAVYQASVDGSEVRVMYDWCYNGVPDVQLVFDR